MAKMKMWTMLSAELCALSLFLLCAPPVRSQVKSGPKLIIHAEQKPGATPQRIESIRFTSEGVDLLSTDDVMVQTWQIGSAAVEARYRGGLLSLRAAQWVNPERLIVSGPLQMFLWDTLRHRRGAEIPTSTIDGFPLACERGGNCAWENWDAGSKKYVLRVQNLLAGKSPPLDFALDGQRAIRLAFSPDGKFLTAALDKPIARIWRLPEGTEQAPLRLPLPPHVPFLGKGIAGLEAIIPETFVSPLPGVVTAIAFSADGKRLAIANEFDIGLFLLDGGSAPSFIHEYQGRITALAFDPAGDRLFGSGDDHLLHEWNSASGAELGAPRRLSKTPNLIVIRPDSQFVAVAFPGASVELWRQKDSAPAMTIELMPDNGGWVAYAPDGSFDTSEGAWQECSWLTPDGKPLPIETYYLDFYHPGLVADILDGRGYPLPKNLIAERAGLPVVGLEQVAEKPMALELRPETGITSTDDVVRFRLKARPGVPPRGVKDLSITQNGILMHRWPGARPLKNGADDEEIALTMQPAGNRITAFAFDDDRRRSKEAVWERKMTGWGYVVPQRTLYVIAVGVGTFPNRSFNLEFADADASLAESALSISPQELSDMRTRLIDWNNRTALQFLGDGGGGQSQDMPSRILVKLLRGPDATKKKVLLAIRDIADTAKPEDAVLIYYSGHGLADDDHFYLVPYDMGIKSNPDDLTHSEVSRAAAHLISDDELEAALMDLKAGTCALIVDACLSGKLLDEPLQRGPMDPGGLARLAYDKNMYLLTASASAQPAREVKTLGHGILTYALFEEGLRRHLADVSPQDGRIELREWLTYAAERVQTLSRASGAGREDEARVPRQDIPGQLQEARFAARWAMEPNDLVLYTAKVQP